MMKRLMIGMIVVGVATVGMDVAGDNEAEAGFSYNSAGDLVAGSGEGNPDSTVHVPGMRFPIESAPAFANSQVWGHGGMHGPPGGECHSNNYSYPWYDNFCETRWDNASFCPAAGDAHQGQDIRPSTCADRTHWVVSATDGTVTNIGSFSVWIQDPSGMTHRYLHMAMDALEVSYVGQSVSKGQRLGLVSDDFGGNPTTIHLHYDINQGGTYLNPYMSLVESYKDLIGESEPPEPTFDIALDARIVGLDDFYADGSSRGIPDALGGQRFEAEIRMTNRSEERLGSTEIGFSVPEPFAEISDYTIYTDHPEYDQHTWTVNSADPSQSSDNPATLSSDGHLEMHGFAPEETKKVVLELEASHYSIGQTEGSPDIRAWLTNAEPGSDVNADIVFAGHGGGWSDTASESAFDDQVRTRAEFDVLSEDEWLFESREHEDDLEGWDVCYAGHHSDLVHNQNFGALALEVAGERACVAAPDWTRVDADRYDEMVIEVRGHNDWHEKALFWAGDDDLPPPQVPCDEVGRVSGADRYGSSVAVSEQAFSSGADAAVLVAGDSPTPDTIVASSLAASKGAPLLLTPGDTLLDVTRDELLRLGASRVYIVGGTAVVSESVEQEVNSLVASVERRAGENRFVTAAETAKEVGAPTGTAVIISAADDHLVDGVAGGSLAAHLGAPVLLVQGQTLHSATTDAINTLGITETIIIGGTAAVSKDVANALPNPLRLGGQSRHETALAVGGFALDSGSDAEHVYITRDDNVIDAFSAAATGDITVLSNSDALTPGVTAALKGYAHSATLVGGTAAVSEQVEADACEAFRTQYAYDNHRAVSFEAPGDSKFHHLVVPLGGEPGWSGDVSYLRLMPLYEESPAPGDSRWQDIGEVFFQNSATQETSSDVRGYIDGIRVDVEELDDSMPSNTGGTSPGGGDPPAEDGSSNITTETSACSSTAGGEGDALLVLLAMIGLVALRRRA